MDPSGIYASLLDLAARMLAELAAELEAGLREGYGVLLEPNGGKKN